MTVTIGTPLGTGEELFVDYQGVISQLRNQTVTVLGDYSARIVDVFIIVDLEGFTCHVGHCSRPPSLTRGSRTE